VRTSVSVNEREFRAILRQAATRGSWPVPQTEAEIKTTCGRRTTSGRARRRVRERRQAAGALAAAAIS